MSTVKDKSEFNIDSAELLIQNHIYCSSIHCSYYGCFQFMMYTLKNHLKISYEDLRNNTRGDSHINTIQVLSQEYRKKGKSVTEASQLNRNLTILKTARVSADYLPDVVTEEISQKTLRLSKQIIAELKSTF